MGIGQGYCQNYRRTDDLSRLNDAAPGPWMYIEKKRETLTILSSGGGDEHSIEHLSNLLSLLHKLKSS
jgi:hypothetical protein